MVKHKPATELPWDVIRQPTDSVAPYVVRASRKATPADEEQNLNYIAHAANKYPDMVEALQQIAVTTKGYPNASREGEIARACLVRIDETPLT